ncbi:superoxide dismutase family protein [Sphingomonas sp.]|uniref:superoxide dismutase family protein n=1 Tax=Sphingomonas sp. TaxID=28214 RepID=UPI002DD65CEC|nr:superoxide dismutase family protein [Sphingomonas sp.]
MIRNLAAATALVLLTAGCATSDGPSATDAAATPPGGASATLRTADGTEVGRVVATETGQGIRIALDVSGLAPGVRGAHVHTIGRCDAPDFASAGAHWNPTSRQHGTQNPAGPHGGDLPNLTVAADGRGTLTGTLPSGTMAGLLDADGAAFVVHAGPDDMKTDPSGNSGGRVACGVFQAG